METITPENLYAVTVWYKPTPANVAAIGSYIEGVKRLVIVDNSPESHAASVPYGEDKAVYIHNGRNTGIATALNTGFGLALKEGARWVLTMDQDSRFGEGDFMRYVALCNAYEGRDRTGLYSPLQVYGERTPCDRPTYQQRPAVMTSGNIVSTAAYRAAGGFRDDFFIDLVDDAFCRDLQRKGYDTVMVNAVTLQHRLGNGFTKNRLFGKQVLDHPPLRHYYIARNTLLMLRTFPEHRTYYRRYLWKRIKRLFLYDNHQKGAKIAMAWRGWQDYRRGVSGAYEDHPR